MFEIIAVFAILAMVGIDQLTKWLAVTYLQDGPVVLWDGVFELRYLENDGVAWGMFGGETFRGILVAVTGALMAGLLVILMMRKFRLSLFGKASLVLVIAGGLGNLIDRVINGYVVDFLYFRLIDFPVFNVADCFVVIGAFMLIVYLLFLSDGHRSPQPTAEEATQSDTAHLDGSDRQDG